MDNKKLLLDETLLFTGNGYIGVRGNFEEGYQKGYDTIRGTYINGFHEIVDISYGEDAYGLPKTSQKMLNVIDTQSIYIYFNGEGFSLFTGEIIKLERKLDIENGYSIRNIEWKSPEGHHIIIEIKRMTSFVHKELFTIDYKITSLNFIGEVKIVSTVHGDVSNYSNINDPRVASGHTKLLNITDVHLGYNAITMSAEAKRSNMKMAVTTIHSIPMSLKKSDDLVTAYNSVNIGIDETIKFTKYTVFTDSLRHDNYVDDGLKILIDVQVEGIHLLYAKQKEYLDEFWKYSKIEVNGEPFVEESVNYSIYQLLASVGKDGKSNVCAKGLSGEGYEGHYFWDTEIYVIPFFTLTNPDIANKLIEYRYSTLEHAKDRALELGHSRGAKIPWRTISGSECSAYFPAGTAQYHINADVAYSIIQNYLFTKNMDMIMEYGYEVLYETARLWLDTGHYYNDTFRIDAVTGPDEYTAIVNNNYYTNAMVKYHLYWTSLFAKKLKENNELEWNGLKNRLNITYEELDEIINASESMYLPINEEMQISLQDDSFMSKKKWDIKNTPKDKFPLLLHFHPLAIYRHKVLKQADVVLAHFLLDNESDEIINNSYHYYEKLTTHDSSLSPCVYSMMASRINETEKAYTYFKKTLRLDLDNLHLNTKDGLHIANAGGTFMTIVYGFAGLRIKEDGLHLKPTLPDEWTDYSFRLNYLGKQVKITIGSNIKVVCDDEIQIIIDSSKYVINKELEIDYEK